MKSKGKSKMKYLGVIAACFVVSVIITGASCPFAGPSTPDVLFSMLAAVLVVHGIVAFACLFVPKFNWILLVVAALLCLVPALFFAEQAIEDAIYLRHDAVRDRFRDNLGTPIPSSVATLEFVPLNEKLKPDLMFRFDIGPDHLKEIIASKGLAKVNRDDLKCPTDLFKDPAYLPLDGKPVLYQGTGEYGEVLTLKVNALHTRAMFRLEGSGFYRDRSWNDLTHMDALAELQRNKTALSLPVSNRESEKERRSDK